MADERKTEKPTPRRLRKARRDGDHPVSLALTRFGALGLALVLSPLALEALYQSSHEALMDALGGHAPGASALALRVGVLAGPLLGAAALGATVVGVWQTGGVISVAAVRWDFRRLSPFGRAPGGLGPRTLALLLALTGGIAICGAAGVVLTGMGSALAHSVGDARAALELAARSCRSLGWWALAVSLPFASADGVLRFVQWLDRHRATPDEARRERREEQGDPDLRQARMRVHRELANSGAARELAHATLLVLGTPSLAVALRYDPHRDIAPRVLLQSWGASATALEALAVSLGVPVEHDSALARALATVPIDHEVPRARYTDIAQALQRAGMFRPAGPPS